MLLVDDVCRERLSRNKKAGSDKNPPSPAPTQELSAGDSKQKMEEAKKELEEDGEEERNERGVENLQK